MIWIALYFAAGFVITLTARLDGKQRLRLIDWCVGIALGLPMLVGVALFHWKV